MQKGRVPILVEGNLVIGIRVPEAFMSDVGFYGLLGALIGAGASLVGVVVSNLLILARERGVAKLKHAQERENWSRDTLQEVYSNCISSLSALINSKVKTLPGSTETAVVDQGNLTEQFTDAHKWLGLLLAFYPNPKASGYFDFKEKVLAFFKKDVPDVWIATELRAQIIELASMDKRLDI